ncbi:PREDICTED: BTB/POZ domain-containing protein FBL11 isoform X3 [Nelumbo nucifera]|uniref:BTB/POZ domain-containing protein FBL11 isoform X3 n=1 Tax=Nelumbo nucifera TaxID=4432 RepID=A0A1U8Q0I7_NELNU|nr:PREDICTED: BTB/POZ domain-containing protein FBL11 isoform X3 [Nelumbo nucifera]
MASTSKDNFVVLELKDPLVIGAETTQKEIFISTSDICTWNLPLILSHESIKVKAERSRLIQHSTYFSGLLVGSFSESCLDHVSVYWNLETTVNVLKFIYGCPLDLSFNNFLPLLEGALFFGLDDLLLECKTWFCRTTSTKGLSSVQIPLDSIIEIWNFGLDHAIDFLAELCTGYFARNFMWAVSCSSFSYVPFNLLCSCIEHPHLTVDSEKHLCEALLGWLTSNVGSMEFSSNTEDDYGSILEKVQLNLLPLWFASGKRRNHYFSKLADESTSDIFSLMKDPSMSSCCVLRVSGRNSRIRLTEYTEKVDLSGCPQITSAFLLSALPCSNNMDLTLTGTLNRSSVKLQCFDGARHLISQSLFQLLAFEAVCEVDVSKCPNIHFEAAIELFCKSFPSLKILKASYCSHFKLETLFHLVRECPLVNEVDLTTDVSPIIPTQVSIVSATVEEYQELGGVSYKILKDKPLLSSITKLVLKGRSDIDDMDLQKLSLLSSSLSYLNIKGCTSVTDMGISKLICKSMKLHSLVVSDTYFGRNSTLVLCSDSPLDGFPAMPCELNFSTSLAFRLQKLHIGGCKNVDVRSLLQLMSCTYSLKSLCLRETVVDDHALNNFSGSSLEKLDISETMVSGASLTQLVRRNPGLKLFKVRSCRKLSLWEGRLEVVEALPYHGFSGEELSFELSRRCTLEGAEFGWGLSPFSLKNLGPAIRSLRTITVGLGGTLGEYGLELLLTVCPLLEAVVLHFQVISDNIVKRIVESLKHIKVLGLCYCLGGLSSLSFQLSMPNLRKLRLERVTPWMTNDDLVTLTRSCTSLIELSLSGCTHLNSDSQQIISYGWPGLISIHLEDCGEVTSEGVSSLFDCKAIEDLSLRHTGENRVEEKLVQVQLPPLLDPPPFHVFFCHHKGQLSSRVMEHFDVVPPTSSDSSGVDPTQYAGRFSLNTVRIAKCKQQRCSLDFQCFENCRKSVHKETIILEWNSKGLKTIIVKERV